MSSLTFSLARTAVTRSALRLRRNALPLSLSLTSGLVAIHCQRPLQFDTPAAAAANQSRPFHQNTRRKDGLDAETVKQLSGGSLSGFVAGMLVSVFSKTLVLLAGIAMVLIQVAARNGIDLVSHFKLKERVHSSRILAMLNQHTAFKLSFAIAFALSAFMSF
ncbi:hypothetical protein MMYC01_202578 [Madurella mycetomatis]|uniref:Fun14 family protein n=1 Tax=Madurella mycetomatis TaxID=100816 RepID=A0A175W4T8_9PEZI|nr:hypothetical protein MMYC01_202578 [Madurella mycetomatis]